MLKIPEKSFQSYNVFDMLRVYCRANTFKNSARLANVSKYAWSQKWYDLGLPSPIVTRSSEVNLDLPRYNIAVVSDLHWGSIYQQKTIFEAFIQECKDRNINFLVNLGDTVEGLMSRNNHENCRFMNTLQEFEDYVCYEYPTGFETSIMISGNHESSFKKHELDYNFCQEIANRRSDITCLPGGSVITGPGNISICLHHGGGSCASFHESRQKRIKQKTIQLMSEQKLASIYLMGHCHRKCFIPSYMNSMIIGAGCFVAPDQATIRQFGGVDVCGLILSYSVIEDKPINIKLDWKFANEYGGIITDDY